ncbi:MAG: dTMP kinase [Firmicutes bacterium]|nr:dTMP kinase [Bacillota bacterium]
MRGVFITLEGIDGAGKSTQAQLLREKLVARGWPALLTREPGGTPAGEAIRRVLLDPGQALCAAAEVLLLAASRAQLVQEVIRPALRQGQVVVCERFVDSSLAYQGFGLGVPLQQVEAVNQVATGGLEPDLTLYLDLPVEQARRRQARSLDRIEGRQNGYHQRVRQGFLRLAEQYPQRIRVLDGAAPAADVAQSVWAAVEPLLQRWRENLAQGGGQA